MNSSLGPPELLGSEASKPSLLWSVVSPAPEHRTRLENTCPGQSPLEKSLVLSPFLDNLLAQLTTLDILRFTNVSRTVRAYTYTHTPSFRVLNFVRFCQENHRFLPNHRPYNGTNRLRNWEYNPSTRKYPYIDTSEGECSCKFCVCYGHLSSDGDDEFRRGFFKREYYYYSHLNSARLNSLFKRLPDGMQLTVLILDGTGVGMDFVEEIFKSSWGGAWLKELSLRRCAKIEHLGIGKWLKVVFSRNWVHGLRVLKLWGCGTISPNGSFKTRYATASPLPASSSTHDNHVNSPNESNMTQASNIATTYTSPAPVAANASTSSLDAQAGAWSNNPTIFGPSTTNGPSGFIQTSAVVETGNESFLGTRAQIPTDIHFNNDVTSNVTTQGLGQNTINPLGSASATATSVLCSSDVGATLEGLTNDQNNVKNSFLGMSQGVVGLAGYQNSDGNYVASNFTPGIITAGSGQNIVCPEHLGSSSTESPIPNNLLDSVSDVFPTLPVAISATAPAVQSTRVVDPTLNLIRFCRQKKINLDIGLCAMKQQCFTLRAHESATTAQNLLAAIGGIAGFALYQRGRVVLAEKRPAERECCQEECKSVELEALCERCVANMTCQKCSNFYCRKHDTGEYLYLLCALCGPCCDTCFETNTTSCSQCSERFCNTHYPSGRCLIAFDLITGDLVAREEDDVISEEKEKEAEGGPYRDTSRNRRYESCKSCKEVTCWECTDGYGWGYCDEDGGGCGEMVCEMCTLYCESCESRFCEDCVSGMDGNHGATIDPYGNPVDLCKTEDENDEWLCCVFCRSRQVEIKEHRDIDPLAMRALFGEKFSLGEICDVLEKDDIERANRQGWLERVLDEFDDYDTPDLIDPDDDESMLDLISSDHDGSAAPGQVNLGEGVDDDVLGLIDSDRSYGGSNEHSCAKSAFGGAPTGRYNQGPQRPVISPDDQSCTELSLTNTEPAISTTEVTTREDTRETRRSHLR